MPEKNYLFDESAAGRIGMQIERFRAHHDFHRSITRGCERDFAEHAFGALPAGASGY